MKFSPQGVSGPKFSEAFDNVDDMNNAIKYLDNTYGIDKYILHHDIDNGVFQLVMVNIMIRGGEKMLISKYDNTNIEKKIEDFEHKYNFEFPDMYKEFLLKYNGGETPKSEFKINKIYSDIRAFYGLGNADKYYHYDTIVKLSMFKDWLKEEIIPIATNVFGDYIMIGIGSENNGKIFFSYHDRANKVIELADNFELFINKCKSEKIGHVKSIEERKEQLIRNGKEKNITPTLIRLWEDQIKEYANIHQEKLILKEDKDIER